MERGFGLYSEKTIDGDGHHAAYMTLRCRKCGSLNVDGMSACGSCGNSLGETDRVVIERPRAKEYSGENPGFPCPSCGLPMERGVLEIAGDEYRPRWIGMTEIEPIVGFTLTAYEFAGYRCEKCGCLLLYY